MTARRNCIFGGAIMLILFSGCDQQLRQNRQDFSKTNVISIALGDTEKEYQTGLRHLFFEKDGLTTPADLDGLQCRCLRLEEAEVGYMYFAIDPTFKKRAVRKVVITAECFDEKPGLIGIQYDASKSKSDLNRAYTGVAHFAQLTGSKEWRTVAFEINDATFRNSQNSRSDFRLCVTPPQICVRQVTVMRPKP